MNLPFRGGQCGDPVLCDDDLDCVGRASGGQTVVVLHPRGHPLRPQSGGLLLIE